MRASVVIAGAGIAGVAVAYHLTELGADRIVLCDPRPPLTLTSDKSTECYRNWWPDAAMVSLMNRSIDILDRLDRASGSAFGLNRRGYLYVTASRTTLERLTVDAETISSLGAGPLDRWSGDRPGGASLLEPDQLRRSFPFLTPEAVGALLVHRAGWMSAQQLGAWMLEAAIASGVRVVRGSIEGVRLQRGRIEAVELDDGSVIETDALVGAAGPLLHRLMALIDLEAPISSELHHKVAFRDHLAVVDRTAPMLIWCDEQTLDWTPDERQMLVEVGRDDLLGPMPAFCHGRPEGGGDSDWMLALWEHARTEIEPVWPIPVDELHAEVVLRGMAAMIPGLRRYLERMPQPFVDGGYYTKAPDNLPLIGQVGPPGFHLCGGLSGYGVMAAPAAGDLVAAHILGNALPAWAEAFSPARLFDRAYLATVTSSDAGQL